MDLLFKVKKSGHDEMMRSKEVSLRYPEQCFQQNFSPLHPMLKWEDVMAQECINEEHAGGSSFLKIYWHEDVPLDRI